MSVEEASTPVASEAPPPGVLDEDEDPATPPRQAGEAAASDVAPTPTKPSRGPRGQPSKAKDKPRPVGAVAQPPADVASDAASAAAAPALADAQKDRVNKPQENAVTARLKKTKMCYFFERGKCASQNCRYAHSSSELRNQPNLQKTKLCKAFAQDGVCPRFENCVFAHGEAELRVTEGIYKTQMCHFYERGRCLKGDRCNHAHGVEDLRAPPTPMQGAGQGGGANGAASASKHSSPESGTPAGGALDPRQPLSPLPLAELLVDSVGSHGLGAGGQLTSPLVPAAMAAAAAGLMTPDLSMGFVPPMPASPPMWNMPWALGNPYGAMGSPGTPMPCAPAMPFPGGMPSPMPHALGGLAAGGEAIGSAVDPWAAEVAVDPGAAVVPCDLSERLASLDSVVQDLRADVRALTGSAAGASASSSTGQAQRPIHRI